MRPVPSPFRSPRRVRITHMSDRPRGCHGTGRLRITAQASAPRAARLVISPAPAGLWQTAATSAGRCDCCSTPYPRRDAHRLGLGRCRLGAGPGTAAPGAVDDARRVAGARPDGSQVPAGT